MAFDFDLLAPSEGRTQVLRSGQPGMDAGLATLGHGWPIAAGPRSRTGVRVCRALARHRTKGARAFFYLALFQVTRCKSETHRSRDRRIGYVHPQESQRRSNRHRRQASSHSVIPEHQGKMRRLSDRHRRQASSHNLIWVHPPEMGNCQPVIASKLCSCSGFSRPREDETTSLTATQTAEHKTPSPPASAPYKPTKSPAKTQSTTTATPAI